MKVSRKWQRTGKRAKRFTVTATCRDRLRNSIETDILRCAHRQAAILRKVQRSGHAGQVNGASSAGTALLRRLLRSALGLRQDILVLLSAGTKTVQVSDLKCVHPTPETSLTYLDAKTWGMGWGKTWWACAPSDDVGLDRKAKGRAIVLQDNAWCRHGFSARNRSAAIAAIVQAIESQGLKVPHAPNLKAADEG